MCLSASPGARFGRPVVGCTPWAGCDAVNTNAPPPDRQSSYRVTRLSQCLSPLMHVQLLVAKVGHVWISPFALSHSGTAPHSMSTVATMPQRPRSSSPADELDDIELNTIPSVVSREAGERDPLLLRSKIVSDVDLDGLKQYVSHTTSVYKSTTTHCAGEREERGSPSSIPPRTSRSRIS